MRCWCGNENLSAFGEGYLRCEACQTLVAEVFPDRDPTRVTDEAADLYGRDYWFDHQRGDLNCPDIISRARTDISERCIHWLRSLLQYKLPPAKVLEIGCAHGGFVAMLRQAGYDATGLELSLEIVRLAKQTFDVPVLSGPIEDQQIPAASFDAIVMMDVMEHLPQPMQTLETCLNLLKPDGILLIQTPCYPQRKSLAELRGLGHKFPQMLDANEHLYLFSENAVPRLFKLLSAPHIEFIPAIFGFYDMSFVVSKTPLNAITAQDQGTALSASVGGRFMQALLDLDKRRLDLLDKFRSVSQRVQRIAG